MEKTSELRSASIQFGGQVDRKQFRAIQKLLLPWWAKPQILVLAVLYLVISSGVGWKTALVEPAKALPDLAVALAIILGYFAWSSFYWNRTWKAYQNLHGQISGTVGQDGVEWNTSTASSRFSWEKIHKYKRTPTITLVFYAPRSALFFPPQFLCIRSRVA